MALKDNLNAVKEELSTEEQFLESVIKGERIFKKYKYPIIGGLALLIAAGIGYGVMTTVQKNNLIASNEAYVKLLKDSNDNASLNVLKEKNPNLYQTFKFQMAVKNNDVNMLEEVLKNASIDVLLKDLVNYQLGNSDTKIAGGLSELIQGYKLMKEGKSEEAKLKFTMIPLTSPLQNIVKNLEHYQGK